MSPELAQNAPERHVVVPGDTLWGIAGKFLKDPFRWNELWKRNAEEIRNPHRIYPGQIIVLERHGADGRPQLKLLEPEMVKLAPRIREESLAKREIPAIPQRVIEPFLTVPLVTGEDELDRSPRIVAIEEGRVNASDGNKVYVAGATDGNATRQWQIYRPGRKLVDPESGEALGYEAQMLGTALFEAAGTPATFRIGRAKSEIARGDRLVPAPRPDIVSYPQRLPAVPVAARILSIDQGVRTGGVLSVISLSRGAKNGVEVGHVLALYRVGEKVRDRTSGSWENYTTPDERIGLIYVFRVFERVAYALVMEADRPFTTGDLVRNP
ncbi:LysM peptidoglycan-binding domain-containing protein [Denitratisoma sp. DHT3]|uniref:LysM peptidoglycan-binding domain-containing protein n=1 Tax=Denitratisoma sp. DHT3 TaxID=1981880 RepID=UPI001C96030E|nr:LysM domain-containing protein [Denitratisoma sp. DHT3]